MHVANIAIVIYGKVLFCSSNSQLNVNYKILNHAGSNRLKAVTGQPNNYRYKIKYLTTHGAFPFDDKMLEFPLLL